MILPHRANPRGCDFRERHVIRHRFKLPRRADFTALDAMTGENANLFDCGRSRELAESMCDSRQAPG